MVLIGKLRASLKGSVRQERTYMLNYPEIRGMHACHSLTAF